VSEKAMLILTELGFWLVFVKVLELENLMEKELRLLKVLHY
jgi:hypothetical protein